VKAPYVLNRTEAANVRAAAWHLRARLGGLRNLAKALELSIPSVRVTNSPTMAFRLARLAGVGVDDILTGKYPPPGTCPYCGHRREGAK
jgi:hypothetical protein